MVCLIVSLAFTLVHPVFANTQVNACDSLTDWSTINGADELEGTDKQEGTNSIKVTGDGTAWHLIRQQYNPSGTWDWSGYANFIFWMKPEVAPYNVYLYSSGSDYAYWDISDLTTGVWTDKTLDLSSPAGTGGSFDLSSVDYFNIRMQQPVGGEVFLIDDIRVESAGNDYIIDLTQSLSTSYSVLTQTIFNLIPTQAIGNSWSAITEWNAINDLTQTLTTSWTVLANLNTFVDLTQSLVTSWNVLTQWNSIIDLNQAFSTTWQVLLQSTFNIVTSLANTFTWIVDVVHTIGANQYFVDLTQALSTAWTVLAQWDGTIDLSQSLTTTWTVLLQASFNVATTLTGTFTWLVDVVKGVTHVFNVDLTLSIITEWIVDINKIVAGGGGGGGVTPIPIPTWFTHYVTTPLITVYNFLGFEITLIIIILAILLFILFYKPSGKKWVIKIKKELDA